MSQNVVGIRKEATGKLRAIAKRKRVSQQGLLTALVIMASGEGDHYGIMDLDWDNIRKDFPSQELARRRSWEAVLAAVATLMEDTKDPEEMAMRSRFTVAQCRRAMGQIQEKQ